MRAQKQAQHVLAQTLAEQNEKQYVKRVVREHERAKYGKLVFKVHFKVPHEIVAY